jgi:hypothetical protein
MSKKLPFFLILVSLGAVLAFLFLTNKLQIDKLFPGGTSLKTSRVSFVDEIGMEGLSFEGARLDNIAGKLGVWESGVYNWGSTKPGAVVEEQEVLHPQKIVVVLTSEEQRFHKIQDLLSDEGIVVVSSLGQEYQEDTLYVKIHYEKETLLNMPLEGEFRSSVLSSRIVFALYNMSAGIEETSFSDANLQENIRGADKYIKDILQEEGLIFSSKNSGLMQKIGSLIHKIRIVKFAYAQSCWGTVYCGVETPSSATCTAPDPDDYCRVTTCNQVCGIEDPIHGWTGACICAYWCDYGDDVSLECSFRTTEAQCTGPTGSCPAPFDCTNPSYQSQCTWIPGPTPTDTPCTFGLWVNQECGDWPCASTERLQTRWVNPAGCTGDWRCVSDATCVSPPTPTPSDTTPPTCTISGPTSVNIDTDATYIATGSDPEGNLIEVEIYKSPTENRSWTNLVDGCAGPVCQGTTQFSSVGTYYVTCNAYDSAGNNCSGNPWCVEFPPVATPEIDCPGWSDCTTSDLLTVTVTIPGPWWQVQDADIITNGSLSSLIPTTTCLPLSGCDPAFGLEGSGGYPGVPSYGGSYDFEAGSGTGTVSSTGWLANSISTFNKVYDYSYFQALVRPDVEINEIIEPEIQGGYLINQGNATRGYVWFRRQGDLTITGVANLQDRKVILLVDGDLYLGRPPAQSGSSIRVRDGSGFFMAIVSGDIIISPKASIDPLNPQPVFEGIFLAEGQVKTGTEGPELDEQLWIRGSVAGLGIVNGVVGANPGVVLERDLIDNTVTPAEFFEYGPDLLFTFPRDLTSRKYKWKEIAP